MLKINFMNLIFYLFIYSIIIMITMNLNSHPIFIMISIIIYTILMSLNLSLWKMNFIYSILLFLIMISGLLIIFLYFSSLISNEQMNLYWNKLIYLSFFINMIFLLFMMMMSNMFNNNLIYLTNEIQSIKNINKKFFENILNLYYYPFNNITIYSIIYLLITLFVIIKISNLKIKPLRKIY